MRWNLLLKLGLKQVIHWLCYHSFMVIIYNKIMNLTDYYLAIMEVYTIIKPYQDLPVHCVKPSADYNDVIKRQLEKLSFLQKKIGVLITQINHWKFYF